MAAPRKRNRKVKTATPEPAVKLAPDIIENLKRTDPEPPAPAKSPELQAVQDKVDEFTAAGDGLPPRSMTDHTNIGNQQARADSIEAEVDPDFAAKYDLAMKRGSGYLQRRRTSGNRTAMVPPNCEIHPGLGMWGLRYAGRWMIIRWLDIRPRTRQKRFDQGWQYFEGKEWCTRLGLVPENYLNERGRVGYMDVELGWAPEEYIFERRQQVEERQAGFVTEAKDKLESQTSAVVPRVEFLEGDDESILGEFRDRKRYAASRA